MPVFDSLLAVNMAARGKRQRQPPESSVLQGLFYSAMQQDLTSEISDDKGANAVCWKRIRCFLALLFFYSCTERERSRSAAFRFGI